MSRVGAPRLTVSLLVGTRHGICFNIELRPHENDRSDTDEGGDTQCLEGETVSAVVDSRPEKHRCDDAGERPDERLNRQRGPDTTVVAVGALSTVMTMP